MMAKKTGLGAAETSLWIRTWLWWNERRRVLRTTVETQLTEPSPSVALEVWASRRIVHQDHHLPLRRLKTLRKSPLPPQQHSLLTLSKPLTSFPSPLDSVRSPSLQKALVLASSCSES